MKEMTEYRKRLLPSCRSAFISTWYLCIFLYSVSLISVMILNDQKRLMTMQNLMKAQSYLNAETAVINDIRCMIADGCLENGTYEAAGTMYTMSAEGTEIHVTILYPYEEVMTLYTDEEGIILDASAKRDVQDVFDPG